MLTSPCNTQASLGITSHGCGWSKAYWTAFSLHQSVMGERTSCTLKLIFFVGLFWLALGKSVLYELLQRARTAASASILVLALCSSWKIPLSGKNRHLVWSWSGPCWVGWRAKRDPSQPAQTCWPQQLFSLRALRQEGLNCTFSETQLLRQLLASSFQTSLQFLK